MARLSAREIHKAAMEAGFTPDEAVTMTAIALAESGGNPKAHNSVNEDSRGLWQINMKAHPNFPRDAAYDPLTNARLAYEVSNHGRDICRWTTAHRRHGGAAYQHHMNEALQGAAENGHPSARGNWTGCAGYHEKAPAAPSGSQPSGSQPSDNRFQGFPTVRSGTRDPGTTGAFPDARNPVATLQNALNIVNHKEGPQPGRINPDGVFGGMTAGAVRAFQSSKALSADGVVGQGTWAALDRTLDSMHR